MYTKIQPRTSCITFWFFWTAQAPKDKGITITAPRNPIYLYNVKHTQRRLKYLRRCDEQKYPQKWMPCKYAVILVIHREQGLQWLGEKKSCSTSVTSAFAICHIRESRAAQNLRHVIVYNATEKGWPTNGEDHLSITVYSCNHCSLWTLHSGLARNCFVTKYFIF